MVTPATAPARAPGEPSSPLDEELVVSLHAPLAERLPVGSGTAVFVAGTCFSRSGRIAELEVVIGAERHRVDAWGLPRSGAPVLRCGFWATVPVPARERPGIHEGRLEARLAGGGRAGAPIGSVEVHEVGERSASRASAARAGSEIAICMATFNPDPAMFRMQIESIRAQSFEDWVCLISDDASGPEGLATIMEAVGEDPRFVVSRAGENRGFYRNFERVLGMVPADASYVALADQDDRWEADKLATLRAAIGDARLVYSDLRLIDPDGTVISPTLWSKRRTNHTNLASLMIANTITGAASMFRRELLDLALPFPEGPPGWKFHDHWLGAVALASGQVAFVDRPLYDYVQHRGAILRGRISGEAAASAGVEAVSRRSGRARVRGALAAWKSPYFFGYRVLAFQAAAVLARCDAVLSPSKRRALHLLVRAERSPLAFAWLLGRMLRGLVGRDETLGMEGTLARGIVWRLQLGARTRLGRPPTGAAYDAGLPSFDPRDFETVRPRWWPRRRAV